MTSPATSLFDQAAGPMPYIVALALVFGGVALLVYAVRSRQLPVSDRVDMMRTARSPSRYELALPERLVRLQSGHGLTREGRQIVRLLSHVGIAQKSAATAYATGRAIFAIVLAILIAAAASAFFDFSKARMVLLLVAMMSAVLGWLLPSFVVGHLAKNRDNDVAAGLPDALELLVVCVGAGLSLEDSIDRVVGELHHSQPALAEELALTSADMKILPSRDQALANLALRVDVPSVRSVVATLSQTMRYGTPLAQALRVVATEMRNDALIDMEARANRLPTLLTLPMMLFIMPTIFLIIGGPAALRVIDAVF